MVSLTVEVVSVCEVIDPCVKLGTTGTAFRAVGAVARAIAPQLSHEEVSYVNIP